MTFNQAFAIALMSAMMTTVIQSDMAGWKSLTFSFFTFLLCRFIWWFFVDRKSA